MRQWWLLEDDSGTLILTEEQRRLERHHLDRASRESKPDPRSAAITLLSSRHAPRRRLGHVPDRIHARSRSATTTAANDNGSLRSFQSPAYSTTTRRRASKSARATSPDLATPAQTPNQPTGAKKRTPASTPAAPDLSGASAIDDDPATLWIAERFVGTPNNTTPMPGNDGDNDYAKIYLSGARLYRWPGEAEKRALDGNGPSAPHLSTLRIINSTGNSVNVSSINGWSASTGDTLIICEDEATFRRYNPGRTTKLDAIGSAFFGALDMATMRLAGTTRSAHRFFSCAFSWGGANRIESDGHQSALAYDPIPRPALGR